VTLAFESSRERRQWAAAVFAQGDVAEFLFPRTPAGDTPGFDELEKHSVRATATGTMHDVLGNAHKIDESLDAAAWSKVVASADQHYSEPAEERLAREVKKIRESLEKIQRRLERS
jgi:hypothetical protein